MRKILFIAFTFLTHLVIAQTGSIRGTILDFQEKPLIGISVGLEGTKYGIPTNESGEFSIKNVPVGTYTLVATGVGYEAKKQNVVIKEGRALNYTLQLSESKNELMEVTVTAKSTAYYSPEKQTMLATRMPMRIFETPQQIQVISRAVMNDQQAQTLSDVFKNTSGVSATTNYGGSMIRGFGIGQFNYLYNGQRGGLNAATIVPFLVNIESVEVLKGSAGVLFGEGGLGGTINMITKKPVENPKLEVSLTGGSFNTYRATIDAGGAISANKKLLYRLNIGYENAKSFTDHFYNKSLIIAPALLYKLSDKTEIEWNASYLNDDRNVGYQNGVPAIDGNIFALPRNFTVNDPNDYSTHSNYQSQFGIKHKFSENFTVNALYNFGNSNWNTWSWGTADYDASTKQVLRYRENYVDQKQPFHYINLFGNYSFQTGKTKHSFVLGYDYSQLSNLIPESRTTFQNTPLDAFNPQYNVLSNAQIEALLAYRYAYDIVEKSNAAYLQYLLNINSKINILMGGRFQKYGYKSVETLEIGTPNVAVNENASDVNVFIPRIGINYLINEKWSAFAGFNQGFRPQSSNSPLTGGPFPAEKGNQFEVGTKVNLFNNRLNTTLSLYQITKTNVLTRDPSDPNGRRQLAVGEVRSQGIELDVVGNISSQWQILGNLSFNDVEVTKSNNEGQVGQKFGNTIPVLANLWTVYKFDKTLNGFKIGGGLNYSDERIITIDPSLKAPAYTLLNAIVGYEKNKFGIDINFNNLTNVDYVQGTQTYWALNINRGAPFNFLATLSTMF